MDQQDDITTLLKCFSFQWMLFFVEKNSSKIFITKTSTILTIAFPKDVLQSVKMCSLKAYVLGFQYGFSILLKLSSLSQIYLSGLFQSNDIHI